MNVTHTWRTRELTFHSANSYDNPYLDVEAVATFRGPEGEVVRRPAFWDGGSTWRVRFAPTQTGTWQYELSSNDATDSGLNGVSGQLACITGERGSSPFDHGFLRPSSDGRHLAHADGAPFFWLGDTHWRFAWERWDESNKPGWPSQFRGVVDRRVEQGFTVYQTNIMSFHMDSGLSACWLGGSRFENLNVDYFRTVIDPRMKYIADSGLLNAVGLAWHQAIDLNPDGMSRFARYIVARYGSYPVAWTLGGEVAGYDPERRSDRLEGWRTVALAINEADDYDHPLTAHLTTERPLASYYQEENWLSFTLNQLGHGDLDMSSWHYQQHLEKHPRVPLVEGESMYEGLTSVEYAGRRTVTDTMVRHVAYRAMQAGCCGYTYGAQGCWNGAWDRWDMSSEWGELPWHEGVDLPGAVQLGHLRRFYEAVNWTALRPDASCFTTTNFFNTAFYPPAVTADPSRQTVVFYFGETYRRGDGQAALVGLPADKYRLQWFDPRAGEFLEAPHQWPSGGVLPITDPPDDLDWLLLVRSVTDSRSGT